MVKQLQGTKKIWRTARLALFALCPALMGAGGDEEGGEGCAPMFSRSEVPAFDGQWRVEYDDSLTAEIQIGGAVYTQEIGIQGGVIAIEHEGMPLEFDLDCTRPDIQCASEVFPTESDATHPDPRFPHQVRFTVPAQVCDGELVTPAPDDCGANTDNPDCSDVCDGTIVTEEIGRTGLISEDGSRFEMFLGADIASNGVNCALLSASLLDGDIVSNDPESEDGWQAEAIENGELDVGFAAACLWADDPDADGELEAAVLSAGVKLTTGFTATRE